MLRRYECGALFSRNATAMLRIALGRGATAMSKRLVTLSTALFLGLALPASASSAGSEPDMGLALLVPSQAVPPDGLNGPPAQADDSAPTDCAGAPNDPTLGGSPTTSGIDLKGLDQDR